MTGHELIRALKALDPKTLEREVVVFSYDTDNCAYIETCDQDEASIQTTMFHPIIRLEGPMQPA